MELEGEEYKVTYHDEVLTIAGKLSLMVEDYQEIEDFFEKVIETEPSTLTFDIRNLEYLNSSGIKTICVGLLLEADEIEGLDMKILCSNRFTWQKETVPTFEDLVENMKIEFE